MIHPNSYPIKLINLFVLCYTCDNLLVCSVIKTDDDYLERGSLSYNELLSNAIMISLKKKLKKEGMT
jgi:hypothetical protein